MIESDREEFKLAMQKLGALFAKPITDELVDTYFTAMKQYPSSAVVRAFQASAEQDEWFPKPVELRQLASSPERIKQRSADGQDLYRCLVCHDAGFVLTDRRDARGIHLGRFSAPCQECASGESLRASWSKADSKGHVFADTAKDITVELRKAGALR